MVSVSEAATEKLQGGPVSAAETATQDAAARQHKAGGAQGSCRL
jgi:hypothetical protein